MQNTKLKKVVLLATILFLLFLSLVIFSNSVQASMSSGYQVHGQTYGWLSWVKNGRVAGTVELVKRLAAIEKNSSKIEKSVSQYEGQIFVYSTNFFYPLNLLLHYFQSPLFLNCKC